MTTSEALLAAVLANPADDLPRLVYADYLEENGETKRAEFIRLQCRLHKWEGGSPAEHGAAILREREMFWRAPSPLREWFGVVGQEVNLFLGSDTSGINSTILASFIVRRGFVAEVHCTLSQWCGGMCERCHGNGVILAYGRTQTDCMACEGCGRTTGVGPAVVRSHPVEVVRVSDREPDELVVSRFGWGWMDRRGILSGNPDHPHHLPGDVYQLLSGGTEIPDDRTAYHSAEDAHAALSAALIAWAKSQPHPARITSTPVSVDVTS